MSKVNVAKRRYWSGHIRGWQSSGLSRRGYCAREGLSLSSFDYWRRRVPIKGDRSEAATALTLIPVRVKESSLDVALLLRSPGGWSLELPASVGAAFLVDVLKRLP